MSAETRRAARGSWEIAISRPGPDSDEARTAEQEHDALFWLRIPIDERAKATWELSRELYELAARNGSVFDDEKNELVEIDRGELERRLPRAAFVVTRHAPPDGTRVVE